MSELVLVRHGETEWSASRQHTGVTDIPLTPEGEHQVSRLRPLLDGRCFGLVLCSPRVRAQHTAELLGWTNPEVEPDLAEWDYGGYEGRTTAEISAELGRPWRIWTDPVPPGMTPGETLAQVAERADRVLARVQPALQAG
ncbi:MAG: histidine phosphatase family protein, partial [Pseudonocardiaceae bacterium]